MADISGTVVTALGLGCGSAVAYFFLQGRYPLFYQRRCYPTLAEKLQRQEVLEELGFSQKEVESLAAEDIVGTRQRIEERASRKRSGR